MAPIVDELAEEVDDVSFGKVDVEDNQDLATEYGVRSIPTFILLEDGEELARKMGAMSKDEMADWIADNS